jgi:hypothetical protein
MLTRVYLLGIAYIGLAGLAIRRADSGGAAIEPHVQTSPLSPEAGGDARAWFASIKPFCNTVEVETALRQSRPPDGSGFEGPAYQAACLALAGKVERARAVIGGLGADQRWRAAGIVFEVAHPVADAGDDKSAGPIMALVADFWPTHYMALYHAGASEHALGETAKARTHLKAFLEHYTAEDGWRSNAQRMLDAMGQ